MVKQEQKCWYFLLTFSLLTHKENLCIASMDKIKAFLVVYRGKMRYPERQSQYISIALAHCALDQTVN